MKTAKQTTMQANVNNNYKIIREFLILNGIGHEYTDCNGDKRIDRARTLDIEGLGTINYNGVDVKLNFPTLVFSRKLGELDGELVFNPDGIVDSFDVNDEYAEIFAEAIKNGDICPLPIEKAIFEDL